MAYKFIMTRGNAILNFSEEYCQSRCELIESESFFRVLRKFVRDNARRETRLYTYLHNVQSDDITVANDLRDIFRLLLIMTPKEVSVTKPELKEYLQDDEMIEKMVEDLYAFWRKLQRYAIVFNDRRREGGYQNVGFVEAQTKFEALSCYSDTFYFTL